MIIKKYFQEARGIEKNFNKKILFVGSESYEAPVITILEGLYKLGFQIDVFKSNINSWFCENLISAASEGYDFCLSGQQWGTRWDLIPSNLIKIMVDGSDVVNGNDTWIKKANSFVDDHGKCVPSDLTQDVFLERWALPLGNYTPDILFTSQKQFTSSHEANFYLPFGITDFYKNPKSRSFKDREIDFAHISGPGQKRNEVDALVARGLIPGNTFYGKVYGDPKFPSPISAMASKDQNIHSYHRWASNPAYVSALGNCKCILYGGIDHWPFWDSKRPWEALSSGSYFLFTKPPIDISEYPLSECDSFAECTDYRELVEKALYLYSHPSEFETRIKKMSERALKYFSSTSLARYFLLKIYQTLHK
tara:strand:+ start:963 stop:2054 length:1092 start_codon:yes stop_codon:yes gene_type:complete